jgi:hypothetical protein
MGSLLNFPLSDKFISRFPIFVETGYGNGDSLRIAAGKKFSWLFSIEIWPEVVQKAKSDFSHDPRVRIIQGNSAEELPRLLEELRFSDPVFFWLDAHCPDLYGQSSTERSEIERMPIRKELDAIRAARPDGSYCVLIDDLRFWADLPWGQGKVEPELMPHRRGLSFLYPFCQKHSVKIILNDSGFALISPFKSPTLQYERAV